MTTTGQQIFSTLNADGKLTVACTDTTFPDPTGSQVLVKMEAAPINPSDLALLTSVSDVENAEYSDGKFVAEMPEPFLSAAKGRFGQNLAVGNEGAGTVIAAGDAEMAQALIGKRVACVPGAAYATHAIAEAPMCLPLGDLSSEQGAAAFVNPMTALGFVEDAKMDGHGAIIHAAAASNLGQMLVKICQEDDFGLVNIVRKQEQVDLLKGLGAKHVVNSSDDDFMAQLRDAIKETGAFLGFDPIGGGKTTDSCLKAMEQVASSSMSEYSRYGSDQDKKMNIYGRLDFAPTILTASYGLQWNVSGWLLTPFLAKAGMETIMRMRMRVLENLTTTFASSYKRKVNLKEMLQKDAVLDYRAMATGEKYLVTPDA